MTDAVVQNGARTDRSTGGSIPWGLPVEYGAIRRSPWKVDILTRLEHVRGDVRQALTAAGCNVIETDTDITVADESSNPAAADIQQRRAAEEVVREISAAVSGAALAIMPWRGARKSSAAWDMCPSGGSAPRVTDIWLIMGMGMLGALLSSVLALSQSEPGGVHYSLSTVQGLDKVGLGALTAVVGIIVLRTLLSNHSTVLSGQPELLAAAVVFGYSQQLFTGLMDKKASGLVDAASPETPAKPSSAG
jgi:hypothetical protein